MTEKKVKIDLKTRLGRPSARPSGQPAMGPAGVVPPPSGIVPPPGFNSGIPAPPFAASKPPVPQIDNSNPFAAVAADEVAAPKPQEIKVEISHDVVQAEKKGFRKILLTALAMVVVGGGLGYVYGTMSAKSDVDKAAIKGAQVLQGDVDKAEKSIVAIGEAVDKARVSLYKDKKYPESFAQDLSNISLDFSADSLAGKNLNRLKPQLLRNILTFTQDVQELKDRKDALRRLFEARKPAIQDLLEAGQNPRISYVVFVGKGKQGPVATFAPIKAPFAFDKDWPANVGIQAGQEVVDAERYKSGEPFVKPGKTEKDKPTVYAIPVEPDGVTRVFPNPLSKRIEDELVAVNSLIRGSAKATEEGTDERPGLAKMGEDIVRELSSLAAAKR